MKKVLLIFLIFAVAFSSAACKKQKITESVVTSVVEKAPQKGGSVRIYAQYADSQSPLTTKVRANLNMLLLMYDSLYTLDGSGKPAPFIARSASPDSSFLEWTFHIVEGISFHDSTPLTAKDVVYTINELVKNPESLIGSTLLCIESAAYISDYSFKITLNDKNSNLEALLTFPIVKEGAFAPVTEYPLGSGPFYFAEKTEGKSITLKRNDNWKGEHTAYLDSVKVTFLENSTAAVDAYKIGLLDLLPAGFPDAGGVNIKTEAKKTQIKTNNLVFLGINNNSAYFSNFYLRAACAHLIDKQKLISYSAFENAIPAGVPVRSDSYLYKEGSDREYNPNLSKEILGEHFPDIKEKPFKILVNSDNAERKQIAYDVATMLLEGGINASVELCTYDDYINRINAGAYELFIGEVLIPRDLNFTTLLCYAEETDNYFKYRSNKMNEIIDAMKTLTDEKAKKDSFESFQKQFVADVPFIPLFFKNDVFYCDSKINGIESPFCDAVYGNLYDVFVE